MMDRNIFLDALRKAGYEVPAGDRLSERLDRLKSFLELKAPEVVVVHECALILAAATKEGRVDCRKGLEEAMAMLDAAQREAPVPEAKPLAGRNDPCPCGSGKKYKKCCLG